MMNSIEKFTILPNGCNHMDQSKQNTQEHSKETIALASYPRSGNTWLRLLISDIILQQNGFTTETNLPIHQDKIIPDIHMKGSDFSTSIELEKMIIKTHHKFSNNYKKIIFLFRSPADCLVSYFYYNKRYEHLKKNTEKGIDEFCVKYLNEWIEHAQSYIIAEKKYPGMIYFMSYENLHNNTTTTLKAALKFLGLDFSERFIPVAINNHSFKKQHDLESANITDKEFFFRKGIIGGGAEDLSQETLNTISKSAVPIYATAVSLEKVEIQNSEYGHGIEMSLNNKNYDKALSLISNTKKINNFALNIDYYRALAFIGKKQIQGAIESAKEELRHHPNNINALSLLNSIYPQKKDLSEENTIINIENIIYQIKPYTMIGKSRLISLYALAKYICTQGIPGNFVECGVAAGGSSALLAWIIKTYSKRTRTLYCFDTFEGMPNPTAEDIHANTAANDTGWGVGTCSSTVQSLIDICNKLNVTDIIQPVKGLFKDTLPKKSAEICEIAFLHMDGDWYESTRDILENLYEQVSSQGIIQVDDYGHWDGCKKAVHEYELKTGNKFEIQKIDYSGVWFRKYNKTPNTCKLKLLNIGHGQPLHPDCININFRTETINNIDYYHIKSLPFKSNSFDAVYHSHLLEHFPKEHVLNFLTDCLRVLKPCGIIRVVVSDTETIARLYLLLLEKSLKGDTEAQRRYDWIQLEMFDQMVRTQPGGEMLKYWQQHPMPAEEFVFQRMGREAKDSVARIRAAKAQDEKKSPYAHTTLDALQIGQFRLSGEVHQWMYDRYSLGKLLQDAGFENIKTCRADESSIPNFNSYYLDIETDNSVRKPGSLFMEATKPSLLQSIVPENTTSNRLNTRTYGTQLNTFKKSTVSKKELGLKILHLCTLDYGGAGAAALRLHLGLLGQGIISNMAVLHKKTSNNSVHELKTNANQSSQIAWKNASESWREVMRCHPLRPEGLELFTTISSDTVLMNHALIIEADIINLHWIPGLIDIPAMPSIFREKKIIWTLHDQNPFTGGCHYSGSCRKFETHCNTCPQLGSEKENDFSFTQWKIKNRAYSHLDLEIVAPSNWMALEAKASSLFAKRSLSVIPYGLPLEIFRPRPVKSARQSFGLDENDFILMFGAHAHTKRKGFDHIKALLEIMPPKLQGKRVVAMAFGHIGKCLPHRIPLIELGFVADHDKLAEYYSLANAYILPAIEDNLPNTVLEALCCGTPAIGFDIGGMPDMITHTENGWLASVGDTEGLVQGAMWARKYGEQQRDNIATSAHNRFNEEIQAKQYISLYKNILSISS